MARHYPKHHRSRTHREAEPETSTERGGWLPIFLLAAVVGGGAGAISNPQAAYALLGKARPVAVSLGLARARVPQPGDYWAGCDDARAAGSAPIYAGEPGYRSDMDGDSDGIACEPHS
jgi:hypothetical protein